MGGSLRKVVFRQRLANDQAGAVNVLQHIIVPESQNSDALRMKPCRSRGVLLDLDSVLPAIHLDDQFAFKADEVSDVATDRCLTAEPVSIHLLVPQNCPKLALGISRPGAQRTGPFLSHGVKLV